MYMLNIRSKYLESQIIGLAKQINKILFFPHNNSFFSSVYKSSCNLFLEKQGETFLEIYNLDKNDTRVDIHFSFSHLLPEVVGEMQIVLSELKKSCKVYKL